MAPPRSGNRCDLRPLRQSLPKKISSSSCNSLHKKLQLVAMSIPTPRLLLRSFSASSNVCRTCQRGLAMSSRLQSGHNKWSTIKHDKAKKDAQMTKQRSSNSHAISLAVKCEQLDCLVSFGHR